MTTRKKNMIKRFFSAVMSAALVVTGTQIILADSITIQSYAAVSGYFEYEQLDDSTVKTTGYLYPSSSVTIPEMLDGMSVSTIGSGTFSDRPDIENVIISDYVSTIESSAFSGCENLQSVRLPERLVVLKSEAFSGNNSLTDIYCPTYPQDLQWDSPEKGFVENKAVRFHVRNDLYAEYINRFPDANVTFVGDLFSVESGTSGYGYASLEEKYYVPGQTVTANITASYSYRPIKVTVNNQEIPLVESSSGTYSVSFTMPSEDVKLNIECTKIYFLKIDTGLNRRCNIKGSAGSYLPGDTVSLTTSCVAGITLDRMLYNGNPVQESGGVYTFTMPEANVSLTGEWTAQTSGSCGSENDDLRWNLIDSDNDGKNDTLKISGSGKMQDYENRTVLPWYGAGYDFDDRSWDINTLVLEEGITHIGKGAFNSIEKIANGSAVDGISEVTIPSSVESIGENAFAGNWLLESLEFAADSKLKSIDNEAFSNCYALKEVTLPASLTTPGKGIFNNCRNLEKITVSSSSLVSMDADAFRKKGYNSYPPKYEDLDAMKEISVPAEFFADYWNSESWTAYRKFLTAEGKLKHGKYTLTGSDSGKVTLSLSADEGYEINSVTVNSGAVQLSEKNTLVYEFDMPEDSLDIAAGWTVVSPVITGASLTLEGQIGLNFYMDIPQQLADGGAYAVMTGPRGTKTIAVSDITPNAKGYCFTYPVNAKEIHDDVTIKFYSGSSEIQRMVGPDADSFSYSVHDYITKVKTVYPESSSLWKLMDSLETYGSDAQMLFSYKTEDIPEGSLKDVSSVNLDSFKDKKLVLSESVPAGITLDGYSLLLESETTIRLYVTQISGSHTYKVNGKTAKLKTDSQGKTYLEVNNIRARFLDTEYTFEVDNFVITCSALSYAYTALNSESENTRTLCDTMRALYLYNRAAAEYFV